MTDDGFTTKPGKYPRRVNDADHIYGSGWFAERTSDGFVLSWLSNDPVAHIVSKEVSAEISAEEFERLRSDPTAFEELALKHDPEK